VCHLSSASSLPPLDRFDRIRCIPPLTVSVDYSRFARPFEARGLAPHDRSPTCMGRACSLVGDTSRLRQSHMRRSQPGWRTLARCSRIESVSIRSASSDLHAAHPINGPIRTCRADGARRRCIDSYTRSVDWRREIGCCIGTASGCHHTAPLDDAADTKDELEGRKVIDRRWTRTTIDWSTIRLRSRTATEELNRR
jgi:hypothetical protein